MPEAYISLGANLGDKRAAISRAIELIAVLPGTRVIARSQDFRTPPWGKTDQDWFVNAAVRLETSLEPHDLLDACLAIEARMGRERRDKWGPRLIDIDIITYGTLALASERLTLPHPHALDRAFVLIPLLEIMPDLAIGKISAREALKRLDGSGIISMDEEAAPEEIPFDRTFGTPSGRLVQISPLIRRIVAPNSGPFTFTGTCTYVLGQGEVTVIDPGPDSSAHIETLLEALGHERISQIVVTHTHRDHSPGAALLKALTGAPILGCAAHTTARALRDGEDSLDSGADYSYRPDREIRNGETVTGPGFTLAAVATPGHTANHLAFALNEENALFVGDHVMAWSTTIVAPPDGSMSDFMMSLEKLKFRNETVYWPGHGGPVTEPKRFVRALIHHRRMREASILTRIGAGDSTVRALTETVYEKLDPRLKGAAGLSIYAHLEDLLQRGVIISEGPATLQSHYRLT